MERRTVLRFGAGAATVAGVSAVAGVGAVAGATVVKYRVWAGDKSGYAVTPRQMASLGATLMVWRGNPDQQIAALTFDDGPTPKYTPGVLKALGDADATATFFMMGKHVVRYPALARQVAERHEVGNHSYTHPDLSHASRATAQKELIRTHQAIERITGKAPVLFRPPYGRFSAAVERVAAELGYSTILWSDRFHPDSTAAANVGRLGKIVGPGYIVLMHDGFNKNNLKIIEALPTIISRVRDRGIQLVGMSELLAAMRRGMAESAGQPTAPSETQSVAQA